VTIKLNLKKERGKQFLVLHEWYDRFQIMRMNIIVSAEVLISCTPILVFSSVVYSTRLLFCMKKLTQKCRKYRLSVS